MVRISSWVWILLFCCALRMCAQQPAATAVKDSSTPAVTGNGTPQFVTLWVSTTKLGSSSIFQKGKRLGSGTKTPGAQLDVRALGLIPAVSALGASAPGGSDQNGSASIFSKG